MPEHSPSWMYFAGGGCAGLPVLFPFNSSVPFLLSWLPSSPLGVGLV